MTALGWLEANNPLYKDVEINCSNIGLDLTNIASDNEYIDNFLIDNNATNNFGDTSGSSSVNSNVHEQTQNYEEEIDDPLNNYRSPANERCLQSKIPDYPLITEQDNGSISTGREIYNIAPSENKHPVSFMTDKLCEELAFPSVVPKGDIWLYCFP